MITNKGEKAGKISWKINCEKWTVPKSLLVSSKNSILRIQNSQFTMDRRKRERALLILDLIFIAKDGIRIETDEFSRIYVIFFRLVNAFSRVIHIGCSAPTLVLTLALPSSFHFVFLLFFLTERWKSSDKTMKTFKWIQFATVLKTIRRIQF